MKKKTAIILGILGVATLTVVGILCWKNRYGAKLYSEEELVKGWIKTEFWDKNKVYGAYYLNPECFEDSDEYIEEYYQDKESPQTRTFLIKDEDACNEIFSEDALDVNFEKEMVVVHIFSDWGTTKPYVLKDVSVDGDIVEISMKKKSSLKPSGIRTYQRCVVIKMKKLDVNDAKVIK